ncbi:Late competence development protein ComFB [Thermincola ferriacetica]|uniref:Late competence development protein ComFB n=2 Tax=Thermincola ferriacetica TaxID=281456 RepID=A0A0L6W688_9FIRM|nr:Late competence development protein ComFB [Thermincola ferriacetica]
MLDGVVGMKKLNNYTETVVEQVLKEILADRDDICKCETCQLDIMAKALNNLPPQYYVTDRGEVFSKLLASYLDTRTKVVTEITKAIMQVSRQPHHAANEVADK